VPASPEAATEQHLLLFNSARFHALNLEPPQRYARIDHESDGKLVGSLCGAIDGNAFVSGFSAPFGGPDLAREDEQLPNVLALLERAIAELRAEGVERIRIHCKPGFYSAAEPVVQYLLAYLGFRLVHCDLNQHVDLRTRDGMEGYLARLKKKRARDVRTDLAEPYEFREAQGDEELRECHEILAANRAAKGRPPGLPLEYVERVAAEFPGAIRAYRLAHEGKAVAAALIYRVLPEHDLLVTWGDAFHELQRSPMNLLAYRLVEASMAGGARFLDLGPSTEKDGSPNAGLVQFKRSVLGEASIRPVFELA
jgi:hypothetical protein